MFDIKNEPLVRMEFDGSLHEKYADRVKASGAHRKFQIHGHENGRENKKSQVREIQTFNKRSCQGNK